MKRRDIELAMTTTRYRPSARAEQEQPLTDISSEELSLWDRYYDGAYQ